MRDPITYAKAVTAYQMHLRVGNRSPRTHDWYGSNLAAFGAFLQARLGTADPELRKIHADDIRAFILYLQDRTVLYEVPTGPHPRKPTPGGLSPFTIRGYCRTLSAFFNWCQKDGLIQRKPTENVTYPKMPQPIKDTFSREDIVKLLSACDASAESLCWRNRAIILLLLDTGIRAGELCGLQLEHLDPQYRRAKITGKGMKDRFVPLSHATREALFKYVNFYRPHPPRPATAVFLTVKGTAFNGDVLRDILGAVGARAGVKVNPHKFRHSAGTLFYRETGNLLLTQQLLGHENIQTTRGYVHTDTADLERVHERGSPVANLHLK